jgi:hypothetical protein
MKVKDKVHPRTGHEGPEGELRYSSTVSLTSGLDGRGWSVPCAGHLQPGKRPSTSYFSKAYNIELQFYEGLLGVFCVSTSMQ